VYQTDGLGRLKDMEEDVSRILVMDGDPSRCALVAEMLAPGPFEIVAAFSGSDAMATIAEEPPDVIVTSLLVAGMSALDLVHWLRARPATEKTPVIVMSDPDQREDLARVLEDEATDFIATSLQTMELRSRVRSMARMAKACAVACALMKGTLDLRTDLTHMIVHDLRTPLQALVLQVQLLRSTECAGAPSIDALRYQVGRLRGLVDEVLVTAKSEAGRLVPSRQAITASSLIEAAAEDVRPYSEAYGTRIEVRAQADIELYVDVALMQRCLVNLMVNALKFAPRGTTVSVITESFEDRAEIAVTDEGPGISDHHRHEIFDRFAVAQRGRSGAASVGLGLSFCKLAVDAHDGTIEHENRSPRGSVFRIVLPLVA